MKAWNERHPNLVLAAFVVLWICYSWWAFDAVLHGRWGWAIVYFIAFVWADTRCRHWYNKTGKEEKGEVK